MTKDYRNLHWHSIADDRPDDGNDWDWPWYSNLREGTNSTWGLHTVKTFDDINESAKRDHPGLFRRLMNHIIDG